MKLEKVIEVFVQFGHTYAKFFDWNMWYALFTDPSSIGLIFTLVLMEGLLSADNAIALAVQVKHLPGTMRKKALMYGLWGAYLFRFIAIGFGTTLTQWWPIKVLGGAYLVWMFVKYVIGKLRDRDENGNGTTDDEKLARLKQGWWVRQIGIFWATVFAVEWMDITFSVDSVLAAFGVSDNVGILILGGMLGILMMRGIAGVFVKIIDKIPELETTAYVLIAFIGLKMLLGVVHNIAALIGYHMHEIDISHALFFSFMFLSFGVTILYHYMRKPKVQTAIE
jgi:YkoY family integral membrane protein